MGKSWEDLKPAVNKTMLILIAGLVWVLVGLILSLLAVHWWQKYTGSFLLLFVVLGLLLGILKGYFIFSSMVTNNIKRIIKLNEQVFILAFISWKSYLLISGMMALGISLRNSTLPKQYLAIFYLGVGLAMIFSSIHYFKTLVSGDLREISIEE